MRSKPSLWVIILALLAVGRTSAFATQQQQQASTKIRDDYSRKSFVSVSTSAMSAPNIINEDLRTAHGYLSDLVGAAKALRDSLDHLETVAKIVQTHLEKGATSGRTSESSSPSTSVPVSSGANYLASLGGSPLKKMPPRGKPKTAARGTGYLETMGRTLARESVVPDTSYTPVGPSDLVTLPPMQAQRSGISTEVFQTAHGYLSQVVDAAKSSRDSLDYLQNVAKVAQSYLEEGEDSPVAAVAETGSASPMAPAPADYLASLGGGTVKKMPPRGKPKTARRGSGYLDNMGRAAPSAVRSSTTVATSIPPFAASSTLKHEVKSVVSPASTTTTNSDQDIVSMKEAHGYLSEIVEAAKTSRESLGHLEQIAQTVQSHLETPKTDAPGTRQDRSFSSAPPATSGIDYLASLGGGPVKKMPSRGKPKTAARGTGYLDNMGRTSPSRSLSGSGRDETSTQASVGSETTEAMSYTPQAATFTLQTAPIDSAQGMDNIETAHGYLSQIVEAAETSKASLSYLEDVAKVVRSHLEATTDTPTIKAGASSFPSPAAGADYLASLGGGPVKKMPPRGKPKTARKGAGYLDNMSSTGTGTGTRPGQSQVSRVAPASTPDTGSAQSTSEAAASSSISEESLQASSMNDDIGLERMKKAHDYLSEIVGAAEVSKESLDYLEKVAKVAKSTLEEGAVEINPASTTGTLSPAPSVADYLASLGGGPVKKMPPRGKPKTARRGKGYLENMSSAGPSPVHAVSQGGSTSAIEFMQPDAREPAVSTSNSSPTGTSEQGTFVRNDGGSMKKAHGYLSEIVGVAETSKKSLDYLEKVAKVVKSHLLEHAEESRPAPVVGASSAAPSVGDYLASLGGGPVKKMPPRGKPKAAAKAIGYLENMNSGGSRPDWSSARASSVPAYATVPAASSGSPASLGNLNEIQDTVKAAKDYLVSIKVVSESGRAFLADPQKAPLPEFSVLLSTPSRARLKSWAP